MANWRKLPPSDKQKDYCEMYKLPLPETRGEACTVIYEHWKARKATEEKKEEDL